MWLLKCVSLPISLCYSSSPSMSSSCTLPSRSCKFMCAILFVCVFMQISVFMVHIVHCVMTLMYNCYMLLTPRLWVGENRIYLNEGVTQRKLLLHKHNGKEVELKCSLLLLLLMLLQTKKEIKIIFPLCTNFNFFSSSRFPFFGFSGAISSEIDFVISSPVIFIASTAALEWSFGCNFYSFD